MFLITPPPLPEPTPLIIQYEIVRQAKNYGVSPTVALRIAQCESNYDRHAKNSRSSATGVYQFTRGTWKYINAEGSPLDFVENIKQFMIHYPKNPQWWECK